MRRVVSVAAVLMLAVVSVPLCAQVRGVVGPPITPYGPWGQFASGPARGITSFGAPLPSISSYWTLRALARPPLGGYGGYGGYGGVVYPYVSVPAYAPFPAYPLMYPMGYPMLGSGYDTGSDPTNPGSVQPTADAGTTYPSRQTSAASSSPASSPPASSVPAPETNQPPTVLVFRDGHRITVTNYAIVGQELYNFSGTLPRRVQLSALDLNATVRVNDDNGVVFDLPTNSSRP